MWRGFSARVLQETKVEQKFTEHDLRAKCASDASTLEQVMVFNTSPNDPGNRGSTGGGEGSGVWQSGDGLATDSTHDIYFVTGNGLFDADQGGWDFGDSFLKISPSGLLLDYFTPHDQQLMNH